MAEEKFIVRIEGADRLRKSTSALMAAEDELRAACRALTIKVVKDA